MYQFLLEIDKKYSGEIADLLRKNDVEAGFYIKESIPSALLPQIILVTAATLNILDILRRWYKERKSRDTNIKLKIYKYDETKFINNKGDEIIGFETKSIEEIEKELITKD